MKLTTAIGRLLQSVVALVLIAVAVVVIPRAVTSGTDAQPRVSVPGTSMSASAWPDGALPVRFHYFRRDGDTVATAAATFGVSAADIKPSTFDFDTNFPGPANSAGFDIPAGADGLAFLRLGMVSRDTDTWPAAPALSWPLDGPIEAIEQEPRLTGVDIGAPPRTPVQAAAPGVVMAVTIDACLYGRHVAIDHGDGYATVYGHITDVGVNVGDVIAAGDLIGASGSAGSVRFGLIRTDYYIFPGLIWLVLCPGSG